MGTERAKLHELRVITKEPEWGNKAEKANACKRSRTSSTPPVVVQQAERRASFIISTISLRPLSPVPLLSVVALRMSRAS
jgi:hypothetical protein